MAKTKQADVHTCGHAVEAHADEGCVLCDCADTLGRETGVPIAERVNATPNDGTP